ncbi:MAG: PhzF family phenazine biosynthesis protein [Verrucomicrobia bacterium]|nr:PhzF family phenazine biosynthesis protein [Verrucomicrobiota bacterium]
MRVPIFQIDAFTGERFRGNPAAVMLLPRFGADSTLQAVAAENNLAETAFLVRDGESWHLRWFTPTVEVPLCGHATLASAWVVLNCIDPNRDIVTFQSLSGPLTVRRAGERLAMDFPSMPATVLDPSFTLTTGAALRRQPEAVLKAKNYLAVFATAAEVRALAPDFAAIARLDAPGVIATAPGDGEGKEGGFDCVSRYFAPAVGVDEDPVTGSAHCTLVPYWAARTGKREIRAWQASARGGELFCRLDGERVELAGDCAFYMQGEAEIG